MKQNRNRTRAIKVCLNDKEELMKALKKLYGKEEKDIPNANAKESGREPERNSRDI